MVLNTPFVTAHRLLDFVTRTVQSGVGGVGGASETVLGRVPSLRLGRFEMPHPIVTFSKATQGNEASASYDGFIGGEVFRRFNLILDSPRNRMILEPGAPLDGPFENDMSGLDLIAAGAKFETVKIAEVTPATPAAEAGLREDDVIRSVDGRSASALGLSRIRALFRKPGAVRSLTVERGGKTMTFRLRLRRLI
jgi:membrane-associated protease RseP (regulator of RpoE activity)